jgi:hypothetical protein
MAFGLWCEILSISQTDYIRLQEVWHMALCSNSTIGENTLQLPKKLDTPKKRVHSQLPMLRLMQKLPTLPAGEKQKPGQQPLRVVCKTWHYWYNPVGLVTKILSVTSLTCKMHFGIFKSIRCSTLLP